MTRQWLTSASLVSSPSPAIIKATLIATATNLVPCAPGCSTCSVTGDMRPAPDKYQGWGGSVTRPPLWERGELLLSR